MKSGRHRKGTRAEREAVVTAHHVMREGGRERGRREGGLGATGGKGNWLKKNKLGELSLPLKGGTNAWKDKWGTQALYVRRAKNSRFMVQKWRQVCRYDACGMYTLNSACSSPLFFKLRIWSGLGCFDFAGLIHRLPTNDIIFDY